MTHTSQRLKAFRLRLAEQLIGEYCSRRSPGRPPRSSTLPCHPPPALPPPTVSGALATQSTRTALHLPCYQERRQCVYCSQYRTPPHCHRVVWYCKECNGKPALCLTGKEDGSDCFRIWHARLLEVYLVTYSPPPLNIQLCISLCFFCVSVGVFCRVFTKSCCECTCVVTLFDVMLV